MNGWTIDLHTHTTLGAYDSALKPAELAAEAGARGLSGVAITEHDRLWDQHRLAEFQKDQPNLLVVNGVEVSTDHGHVLAFGLPAIVSGIHRLARLREVADEAGAFLVAAHPFRHWLDESYFRRRGIEPPDLDPDALARLPLLQAVDGLEVLNGCNTDRENDLALAVARRMGKPGIGGSDCHSRQGVGYCCTAFEREIESLQMLVAELMAGRCRAVASTAPALAATKAGLSA